MLSLGAAASLAAAGTQKVIVADFEDLGTWRTGPSNVTKPAAWFALGASLGGSHAQTFHDQAVGELQFAFDPAKRGPYRANYVRQKMMLVAGTLDGIEFAANANGLPVSLGFVVGDSAGKKFETTAVLLSGGWKPYRIDLNAQTLRNFAHCKFPAHLEQIILKSDKPCEGSLFLDDIALTGDFALRDQISIFPVAEALATVPDKPSTLRYRVRNARPAVLPVTTRIEVRDFDGAIVARGESKDAIPAQGQVMVPFALPPLPAGAYTSTVTVDAGTFQATYDDPFGVFVPNGKRLNHHGMWFGIGSFITWSGPAKMEQRLDWMRQLGVDLDRVGITANRLEPLPGVFAFEPWRRVFKAYADAGVDIQLLHDGTPTWTQTGSPDGAAIPQDEAAYSKYVEAVGTFLKGFPNIRYVEFLNEPDAGNSPMEGFFHGNTEGYLKTFHLFSQAIRATAPAIKITNAGLTVIHPKERPGFAEAVIKQGAPDYDIAAFHAHGPLTNYEERQRLVERWMSEAGIDKPICNTETGDRSGYDAVGRASQAVTLVKKIVYAKSRPNTEFYSWFTLQDYWDMDPKADDSFGLVTSDNRPKASFVAYNELIRRLADTRPEGKADLGEGLEAYVFRRDNGATVYACWGKPRDAGALLWLRTPQPITRVGMLGAVDTLPCLNGVAPVSLRQHPFYLELPAGAPALTAAPPGAGLLELSGPVRAEMGEKISFALKARNPSADPLTGQLAVEDAGGRKLWQQAVSLPPGQQASFDVSLPEAAGSSPCRVVFQPGSGARITFPLSFVSSYPINRAPGDPMASAQAAFVQGLPAITLNRQQDVFEMAFDPAIPPWKGPDDLSVAARACHDDGGIYFRFDVTDDKHVQTHPPNELWRGDSVQVAIAGAEQGRYTIVGLGLLAEGPVAWCSDTPDKRLLARWNVPLRIQRRGTLTQYEVYLPFDKLGFGYKSGEALPVRFAFLVNEDDGQGRVRYLRWYDGIGRGMDIGQLGHGTLKSK